MIILFLVELLFALSRTAAKNIFRKASSIQAE
jgi:hypothetical protein